MSQNKSTKNERRQKFADRRKAQVVRLPEAYRSRLEQISDEESILLADIHDEAVENLLAERKSDTSTEPFLYFASSKNDALSSVWISNDLLDQARKFSDDEGVSVRAFLLTAFVKYIQSMS